jgi:dipeptidyl aminopeptidase/acylaminoacyl peptidase
MNRFLVASVAVLALTGTLASTAAARPFTQRDLVALDRVGDPHISPDGKWVVYNLATLNAKGTGRSHTLMLAAADGRGSATKLVEGGSSARWSPDGKRVFYIKGVSGTDQVWSIDAAHPDRGPQQVTYLPSDVGSFKIAPNGVTLVVSMAVIPGQESPAQIKQTLDEKAAKLSSGTLYDHVFVRHWDTWDDHTKNHLFALKIGDDGQATGAAIPLMKGFDGDAPSKPFGGDDDYTITTDSKAVVFSARLAGKSEPWSTNFDLWSAPLDGSSAPHDFTAENKAWDAAPAFSVDGSLAAHRAMKRPGFEADRFGVILYEDATKKSHEIDPHWDRSADQIAFAADGKSLYVEATDTQTVRIFRMDVATGKVEPLTTGGHVGGFDLAHAAGGDVLTFTKDSMAGPPQVYVMKPGQAPVQITHAGEAALKGVEMSAYEPFTFTGWNKEPVHGWIVKPTGWKPGAKFPTVFLIHGGPQGSWEDSWSSRWNPQVWAGWGYGVVMVDFHGSTGYGQAFTDAISGHWGDRPLEDLKKGWAAAQSKAKWIDASNACAAGASYGGFMTYWIAGVWNQPWKCLIDHDGVFDNRIMGYATEELWFSEWENGGHPVWVNPAAYEKFNPVNHVKDWSKPMLVVHSAKDYRIPLEQGLGAFTAMQRKGIESEFLTFPDENHWVLKPQNSLQWHDTVQAWLKKHIG